MTTTFDSDEVVRLGWRQGAILGTELSKAASKNAPETVSLNDEDWFILTSHDCDIANLSIDKEPVVEVLRAQVATGKKADKQQSWGRNPRTLQVVLDEGEERKVLSCKVHDRWTIPRHILMEVQGTDEITLADIEPYQRFDADWVSFEDDTTGIPPTADMTS